MGVDLLIQERIRNVANMKPTDDMSKDYEKFSHSREKIVDKIVPYFQEPRRKDDKSNTDRHEK